MPALLALLAPLTPILLVMGQELNVGERGRDGDGANTNEPAHRPGQSTKMPERRADRAVAPRDMVTLRTQTIMRQLDALEADLGMPRVADIAAAARAVMWVNIVREAGS